MIETIPSTDDFCTRRWAADYLKWKSPESVDARLTRSETFVPGKLRFRLLQDGSSRRQVRIYRKDVLAMLEPFETDQAA